MLDVYIELKPIILRTAVYVTRTHGSVRGVLRQFLAEPSARLCTGFFVHFLHVYCVNLF